MTAHCDVQLRPNVIATLVEPMSDSFTLVPIDFIEVLLRERFLF